MTDSLHSTFSRRQAALLLATGLGGLALAGCTTTAPGTERSSSAGEVRTKAQIDAAVPETLRRLYQVAPGSQQMASRAAGVLVFPDVVSGGIIIGAQHGRGALQQRGRTTGYYSLSGGSVGLQAGLQSRAIIYVFNSSAALQEFRDSDGWGGGMGATVAAGNVGATGMVDSETSEKPVVSFVITNAGLEGGVALRGFKISPLTF
ncbi:MAG: YSC84-related protein [Ottowia sp.]|nr:YSC84-related protein [Ottowia sp.]